MDKNINLMPLEGFMDENIQYTSELNVEII